MICDGCGLDKWVTVLYAWTLTRFVGPSGHEVTEQRERRLCATCADRDATQPTEERVNHGLDTDYRVCFYEQEFYPLSNFSAFTLRWKGYRFDTSEAAYHWEKFHATTDGAIKVSIREAPSAHEAFKIAERNRDRVRHDWATVKVDVMREILRAKVDQHEYVRRKLLATGDRELVEKSWRDSFWGWGAYRDGQNQLGRLWMQIRTELRGRE